MEMPLIRVLRALESLRVTPAVTENTLHACIAAQWTQAGLTFAHEVRLSPHRRIDFVCEGVGVEVKRGKPARAQLLRQLTAYAQSPQLCALLLVVERNVNLPPTLAGKPLHVLSLNRLWGIAL